MKSLAVMSAERNPTFPDVPTLKEATGSTGPLPPGAASPARGPAAGGGRRPGAVLKEIHDGQEFHDFMAQRGFGVVWRDPEGFREYMAESNEALGSVMKAVGIAN